MFGRIASQLFKKNFISTRNYTQASIDTITTIETNYDDTLNSAAVYLLRDQNSNSASFIDNNTSKCVPAMLNALTQVGLTPQNVKYIIITHAHLDHAGGSIRASNASCTCLSVTGSSALLEHCPNAMVKLVVYTNNITLNA